LHRDGNRYAAIFMFPQTGLLEWVRTKRWVTRIQFEQVIRIDGLLSHMARQTEVKFVETRRPVVIVVVHVLRLIEKARFAPARNL